MVSEIIKGEFMSDKRMTTTKLSIVGVAEPEEHHELQDQVEHIMNERLRRVCDDVRLWMLYMTSIGHKSAPLIECQTLLPHDRDDVIKWLVDEGFTVKVPRFWGQVRVYFKKEQP